MDEALLSRHIKIPYYFYNMNKGNERKSNFIRNLEKGFLKEMPRIQKEIDLYEKHLKTGKLNSSPKVAPQFKKMTLKTPTPPLST